MYTHVYTYFYTEHIRATPTPKSLPTSTPTLTCINSTYRYSPCTLSPARTYTCIHIHTVMYITRTVRSSALTLGGKGVIDIVLDTVTDKVKLMGTARVLTPFYCLPFATFLINPRLPGARDFILAEKNSRCVQRTLCDVE
jgi:hypothetical protein